MRWMLSRAAVFLGLAIGSVAIAQPPQTTLPQPRITSVFPTGAKSGTTIDATVNGTDLDDGTALLFSHPGLSGEIIVAPAPKTDAKTKGNNNRRGGPPPTSVKCKITVAANVPTGQYDVRLVNRFGLSNPRSFVVSDKAEVEELEPNDDAIATDSTGAVAGGATGLPSKNTPRAQRIKLGTVVNGVISTPTDVDYTVFKGKAKERVLIHCATSSIDSRARPLVELYETNGKRLGLNRNYQENDALCDVTLPADGDYFVRVSEFAYQQGGPDYFYRLTVSTGPWIDAVYPPAVTPGQATSVTVYGRNLPGGKAVPGQQIDGRPLESITKTITPPNNPTAKTKLTVRERVGPPMGLQDGFEFRLPGSNAVPIFLSDAKIIREATADNDKPETAESIPVPCDVVGLIEKQYDRDFYSFTAKKGDVYYVELLADRIGSAADLSLRVRNEKSSELAGELDDDNDSLQPITFFSRSSDPATYKFTVPADGKYFILVGSLDANVNYGMRCFYRLRVSKPTPDFRAIVMPRSRDLPAVVTAQAEGETAYDVFIHRVDGLNTPVTVTATGLPKGITAKPSIIGGTSRWGTLVISAAANAPEFTGPITITCSTTIDGKAITREARHATITWGIPAQQNVPTITRLDQQTLLAVRPEKAMFRINTDMAKATVKTKSKDGKDVDEKVTGTMIYAKPGEKVTVPVKVTWQSADARANPLNITAEATQPNPQSAPITVNNNQPVVVAKDKTDAPVVFDVRNNAVPGTYAITLRAETQVQYARDPSQKDKKTAAAVAAYTEPVQITIVPTAVAKLTVQPVRGGLKLGSTTELVVKVDRLADYTGAFEISVTLPKDTKGVTVKNVTVPAGSDEAKLSVTVATDAKVGQLSNVIIQASATLHGKFQLNHEAKTNLNIVK